MARLVAMLLASLSLLFTALHEPYLPGVGVAPSPTSPSCPRGEPISAGARACRPEGTRRGVPVEPTGGRGEAPPAPPRAAVAPEDPEFLFADERALIPTPPRPRSPPSSGARPSPGRLSRRSSLILNFHKSLITRDFLYFLYFFSPRPQSVIPRTSRLQILYVAFIVRCLPWFATLLFLV